MGQSKRVAGQVTDTEGQPLIGASVVVLGTTQGILTDEAGTYQIQVEVGDTLRFSYIGFEPRKIAVGQESTLDVTLESANGTLEEVVVIGYQTIKKKDLTGAVSTVDSEQALSISANSLAESIQGLAAGVKVRNGGAPGQNGQIEIRGVASFVNTSPLYVIDGMIADANQTINNNDIESIQILKDASAAAIYGSRAANGVIIITTKRGREGPMQVSFSGKSGIQQIPNRWDVMNAAEFAEMQRIQYQNSGLQPLPSVGANFDPSIDTDWQDELIRTGQMHDYNLSVSGGSQNSSFLISASHFENTGVLTGRSFNRSSLRVNTEGKRGIFTVGENLLLTNSSTYGPNSGFDEGNPFFDMPQMLPVIPVQDESYITPANPGGWGIGTTDAITFAKNQVAVTNLSELRQNFAKLLGNGYIRADLLEGLYYKFNAGVEVSYDFNKSIRRLGITQFNAAERPSSIGEERSQFTNLLFEHTLNFDQEFGRHIINGVVGFSRQRIRRDVTGATRSDILQFTDTEFTTLSSATGESFAVGFTPQHYLIQGYLGRVNYSYDDRYYLTLTGRVDQDSRFSEENRTGIFPSIAGAWRISREEFFDVPWVTDLKLNASYGELGIVTIGSWDYVGTINNNPRAIFGPDQQAFVGAYQARLVNSDLRWETRKAQNYGISGSLFDGRFSFNMAYYDELSEDALLNNLPIAWYLGNLGGEPPVNAGSIRNRGFELEASYGNQRGDFRWNAGLNLTTINNTIVDVGNQGEGIDYIQTGLTRSQIGGPVAEWYLIQADGIFQSEEEVLAHVSSGGTLIQPAAQPGDIRYIDLNDDGQITDDDRAFTGASPWPSLETGGQFNMTYKGFSFNLQLVGIFGVEVYNSVRQTLDGYQNTNFRRGISPWTAENPNTDDPRIGVATNDQGLVDNARNSDRWLEDASYLRVRNIQIAYQFNEAFTSRLRLNSLQVYASAQNALTLTSYSGLDPDVTGVGILERGVDAGNWPASRVFSLGLQFGL